MSSQWDLSAPVQTEIIIKKSRFIALIYPATSVEEIKAIIASLRNQYADSRHVCVAWSCHGQTGLDDDGEPSGTAAKPMYQVMQHKKVRNFLAVVVRYFGGIKLGAGGLVRAYGGAVSEAMNQAELVEIKSMTRLSFRFDYTWENPIRTLIHEFKGELIYSDYSEFCGFQVSLEEDKQGEFTSKLIDLTQGSVTIQDQD